VVAVTQAVSAQDTALEREIDNTAIALLKKARGEGTTENEAEELLPTQTKAFDAVVEWWKIKHDIRAKMPGAEGVRIWKPQTGTRRYTA
jgi:hypothetical protein